MHSLELWYLMKEVAPLSEGNGKTKNFFLYKSLIGDAI